MTDISSLEAQHQKLIEEANKLGEEIQRLKSKQIDWSKMPVDTLVEVSDDRENWNARHFSHCSGDLFCVFHNGATSKSGSNRSIVRRWKYIRLIENEPKPWFGGECPIPDGVGFKGWLRDTGESVHDYAILRWSHDGGNGDIIAYQILGEK